MENGIGTPAAASTWLIALPEAWRAELLLRPRECRAVASSLAAGKQPLRILDWGDRLRQGDAPLIVAALDLSTAELLLKLGPAVRAIALANDLGERQWPFGGRRRMLERARALPLEWVAPARRPRRLPRDLRAYLEPALRAARGRGPTRSAPG